eukprot:CAMPEP_0180672174 /NCGR_PEP_ID=MMETSP1037_2-20121125/64984_1 /TAXON_ID=632150 /ORGANISM="Azadinium spinosum, Strain 3D9" /LENGTH=58 /DNA_ID=CAMNT_0022701285 /DNA_START=39 /DNA_END=215 /DNA_ORIENTATION=+
MPATSAPKTSGLPPSDQSDKAARCRAKGTMMFETMATYGLMSSGWFAVWADQKLAWKL